MENANTNTMRFITPTLPTTATKEDKVFAAISDFTGKMLVSVIAEANRYCFKCVDNSIHVIDKRTIDEFAGV
jgi:hypothetical protein